MDRLAAFPYGHDVRNWLGLLSFAALCGCELADSEFPDVGVPDAGMRDASPPDAEPPVTCNEQPELCLVGQICEDGECVSRVDCSATEPCFPPEVCSRTRVDTGTVSSGQEGSCRLPSLYCESDEDCIDFDGVCTALGRCAGPTRSFETDEASNPHFIPRTTTGTTGCSGLVPAEDGSCRPCSADADCSPRLCDVDTGICVGNTTCEEDGACNPQEVCNVATRVCEPDFNCTLESAVLQLEEGVYRGVSICPGETDVWQVTRPRDEVARFVLTATFDVDLSVAVTISGVPFAPSIMKLPGVVAFDIPAEPFDGNRTIEVAVSSIHAPVRYSLQFEIPEVPCGRDALTMVGEVLALLTDNGSLNLRVCDGDAPVGLSFSSEEGAETILTGRYDQGEILDDGMPSNQVFWTLDDASVPEIEPGLLEVRRLTAGSSTLTWAGTTVSSGVDQLLTFGTLPQTRPPACDAIQSLSLGRQTFEISDVDLGTIVCGESWPDDNPDIVAELPPITEPSVVTIEVQQEGPTTAEVLIALIDDCTDLDSQTCARSRAAGRRARLETLLEDGQPILWISAEEPTAVSVDLSIEPAGLPAGDECRSAVSLEPPPGLPESARAETWRATDTVRFVSGTSCRPAGTGEAPEVFRRVDLVAGQRAEISLTGPPGGLLWVARDCTRMESTCVQAPVLTIEEPRVSAVIGGSFEPAASYFIAIDGIAAEDRGSYELTVVKSPECTADTQQADCDAVAESDPDRCGSGSEACRCGLENRCRTPPDNDGCGGALPLLAPTSTAGFTRAATDAFDVPCAKGFGPDVVYRVDVPAGTPRLVARVLEADFDAALLVQFEQCGASISDACNADVAPGRDARPQVIVEDPEAGRYFIIVDTENGSGGSFVLETRLE